MGAGGPNKQGGLENYSRLNWQGGRKFMVAVQQPHKHKTSRLVSLEGNTFQNFAANISFIIWVTQQRYQVSAGFF